MIKITIDMAKAVEIQKDKMRAAREPLLAALDVQFMRAVETENKALQLEITAKKQALRDVTNHPDFNRARTPEQLKRVWPEVLNG